MRRTESVHMNENWRRFVAAMVCVSDSIHVRGWRACGTSIELVVSFLLLLFRSVRLRLVPDVSRVAQKRECVLN